MSARRARTTASVVIAALAVSSVPVIGVTTASAATAFPLTIDYAVSAGEANHVGGGNLHPFDERGPSAWLTDGISINAVRGQDYSKRENPYYENLPGWFEGPTHDRLEQINPDAALMIGTYYGWKGKVAAGEYGGNTDWKALAQQNGGSVYKEWIADEIANADAIGRDVHSWIPFNEPDLQWGNRQAYFVGHENAYDGIKAADADALVQAPELAHFDFAYLTAFLTYCKANNCIPDVLSWHELTSGRVDIEGHTTRITDWLEANGIPVMPFAITEYQGTGYSTTDAGRRGQGNYNPGLSVSYLGELERASESSTLDFALRSQWGLPGNNPNARGLLGEMATFEDNGKMATGTWYVYNKYWDMTGGKVGAVFDKTKIDAVVTYDSDPTVNRSAGIVGNWESSAKTVPVTLQNIPEELVKDGRVHIQAEVIGESLAVPLYGTVPVLDRNIAVDGGTAAFSFDIPGRSAVSFTVTTPMGDPVRFSADGTGAAQPADVSTTGSIVAAGGSVGGVPYVAYSGGQPSSYENAGGDEIATESGDSVTYGVDVDVAGIYSIRSTLARTPDGGFVQPYLDGSSFGTPIDFYSAQKGALDFNHGTAYLEAGRHDLTYRLVGAGKNTASSGHAVNVSHVSVSAPGIASDEFRVSFDPNGGGSGVSSLYTRQGQTLGNVPPAPVREGHVFAGWNTAEDGSGDEITAAFTPTADVTVWAVWRELGELVYFVDAGDINPSTLSPGAQFGTHQSVTEQFFGADAVTGKQWGLLDTAVPANAHPGWLTGAVTWPAETLAYTDATPSAQTYRYAKDQTQPVADRPGIPYRFQVEDGEYHVELSIATAWPTQVDRGYRATVILNEGTPEQAVALEPTVLSKDWQAPIVARSTTRAVNGFLTVNVDMADQASASVVVNEIRIHRLVADEPVEPDTTRPQAILAAPTSVGPFSALSVHVDASDDRGLSRVVANIYRDGALVKSTQTAGGGAMNVSHTATVALPDGTYSVKFNAQDLSGNTSKTGSFGFAVDATAPTAAVKEGSSFTVGADGVYEMVSFKLSDQGKIDRIAINGSVKDLTDNAWSDVNFIKPGVFGAVAGVNEIVVYDKAGNATSVAFTLVD